MQVKAFEYTAITKPTDAEIEESADLLYEILVKNPLLGSQGWMSPVQAKWSNNRPWGISGQGTFIQQAEAFHVCVASMKQWVETGRKACWDRAYGIKPFMEGLYPGQPYVPVGAVIAAALALDLPYRRPELGDPEHFMGDVKVPRWNMAGWHAVHHPYRP